MLLSLLAVLSLASPSHADDAAALQGRSDLNFSCTVKVDGQPGNMYLDLGAPGRTYVGVRLQAQEDGNYSFETLVMDYGGGRWQTPIGAPITIPNIGLLNIKGSVQMKDGAPKLVSLYAVGGLANWYRSYTRCHL